MIMITRHMNVFDIEDLDWCLTLEHERYYFRGIGDVGLCAIFDSRLIQRASKE